MESQIPELQGVINLDKPAGLSSARAVARVKRLLPRGTKIGHAGTLDPFATGVLLLLVGKATRQCEALMDCPKQYEAVIRLGATSATDDPESDIRETLNVVAPELSVINSILVSFTGRIMQLPPVFSAMKIKGRRAYDLARRGQPVELKPRPVRIDAIEMLDYNWPLLRLRIDCGRGTYIRSIARDLGSALGVGGYLTELRRTRIGPFFSKDSVTLDQLQQSGVPQFLASIAVALTEKTPSAP